MAQLLHQHIISYKDSPQIEVRSELHDFGWFKTNMPRVYHRELEHNLMLTITGPDGLEAQAKDCFRQAAIAGIFVGIASAFAGAGLSALGAAGTTAIDTLKTCLENKAAAAVGQIDARFDDVSGWTPWHP